MALSASEHVYRYADLRAYCRRFDRDASLRLLSVVSRGWDGRANDGYGRVKSFLPWDVAGVAALVLRWGTRGGPAPTLGDIERMCWAFFNVEHPDADESESALAAILRTIYSQSPFQFPDAKMNWARAVALFRDTAFRRDYQPEVMKPGWQEELLGCSIEQWVSAGFALYSASLSGIVYPFEWTNELRDVLAGLGGADGFDRIVRRGFSTTVAEYRDERRAHIERFGGTPEQQLRREPFSFNPLFVSPFISDVAEHFVAPCFPAIEVRASALGVLHEGTGRWGDAFRRDAGQLFEQYVGRQLREIEGAQVLPEKNFGPKKERAKSIDWFVVLPDVVLLIECKVMAPDRFLQEGFGSVERAHGRLNKPILQINRTAQALARGDVDLAAIPRDRPVVALIVTFGNFVIANSRDVRERLTTAVVPTAFVGVDFLETLVTTDPLAMSEYLSRAKSPTNRPGVLPLESAELIAGRNRLLDDAFEALPILSLGSLRG
ncbi:nuclease-related domain-containing protein [Microbacterium sp. KSW4-4]|uniref:nuclease-related domain-containing protein n=1 Tax=Microbacterium sp. KSW4-4 TaxID=2851651 RepID=UPI001FFC740A|nr:nuclease-related domain-containing protein [Microbacterium sp. KSW4-4]MCK2032199.1 NERD domain-containing protein [Microbacterium sp. KSW4-4]